MHFKSRLQLCFGWTQGLWLTVENIRTVAVMSQFYGCGLMLSSMRKISVSLIKFPMSHEMTGLDCLLSSLPHLFVFHVPVFLLYIGVPISVKCVRNYASKQYFRLGISKKKGWMGEIAVVWWQKDPQRGWCTEEKEWWCIKAWRVEEIVLDTRQYWHFLATGRGFSGNRWAVYCYQASWKLVYKGRVLYRNTVVMRNDVPSNRNTTRCCYWYNDWLAGWGVDCSQIKIEVIFHLIY